MVAEDQFKATDQQRLGRKRYATYPEWQDNGFWISQSIRHTFRTGQVT